MYASCIAVRGSLLHNYIITKCVNDGKEVTKEMFDMRYMYQIYSGLDLPPDDILELVYSLNSEFIKINYDIGNSAALGFDCSEELNKYGE